MWNRSILRSLQPLASRCSHSLRRCRSTQAAAAEEDIRGPFSEKVQRLSDEIAGLSPEELASMSVALRRTLGLPEPPPVGAAVEWQSQDDSATPDADSAAPAAAQEKTSFSVKIEKFEAASKIKVIKEVRAATDLGLKEAKEFVEKVPAVVKSGLSKEEASQLVDKLKAAGATAVVE